MRAPGPAQVPDNDIFRKMFLYHLTLNVTGTIFVFDDDDDDDDVGDKSNLKCLRRMFSIN